jgi:urea transport system substrate-binding protein
LGNQGVSAEDLPVVAFSVSEEELSGLDTTPLVGHLAAWNYFMSVDTPENEAFIAQWHDFIGSEDRVTNDPMEAHYIGFKMWVQAVQQAGTTHVDAVRQAMYGQEVKNLSGGIAVMNTNHHLSKPVLIGEIQDDGQFDTVWETDGVVVGDAWSDFIPESAKLTANWTYPWVCGNCEVPKYGL